MARNEIDVIDVAGLVAYPVFLGILLGIFTFSVDVLGGFNFNQTLFADYGIEVTIAALAALAAGGWIIVTNEIDGSDYETHEYAGVLASLGFPALYMVLEPVQVLVNGNEIAAVFVWLAGSAVTVYVAYIE
ncbi:hypothetical protein [Halostella salina]|uniref:hypothetical protein n=1 Tax=Halostella salina TaxID=1547897 RepID=UPI000EF78D2A|nr:hypothetical protein [Halostella salina]